MRSQTVSIKLQQIAEQVERYPEMVFTTLIHKIDVDFLREAFHRIRKKSFPGVDKMTAKKYAENLEENLIKLHQRMKSGKYVAPPVKRVWIEKENKKLRPIGMPTFEDKIVQRSVEMILSTIYEREFYNFSLGYRAGHSQHQALNQLREQCIKQNIKWIISADITGLFDNIDHGHLRDIICRRVNDGGIMRFIGKWLNAGVLDGGAISYPERGTPQGGVISPLFSNIFLHHILDDWFVREVKLRIENKCFIIRWADDFIIGCENETDARHIMEVLPKRFSRFGLELNQEKTRLIYFGKPKSDQGDGHKQSTFDYIGFTFYWSKSRKGNWVIKKKTARKSLNRFLKKVWYWCDKNRHEPIKEQFSTLCSKLRGFYQYFGVRSNYKSLEVALEYTEKAWRYWLSRRSHKGYINWEKFEKIRESFPFPKPRIVHNI